MVLFFIVSPLRFFSSIAYFTKKEKSKLIISIDKDEILKEWIKQGYPEELRMPEETEPEESEN